MIDGLVPPWNQKNKGLLIGDFETSPQVWDGFVDHVAFSQIHEVSNGMAGLLGAVRPFHGLELQKPDFEICFHGHSCNLPFQIGTWIGFSDFTVRSNNGSKMVVEFDKRSVVWTIPEVDAKFPLSFVHIFSGGFNGWERATKWMECSKLITVQQEVAIDHNEQAMQLWQLRSNGFLYYGKVGCDETNSNKYIGRVADCSQKQWMNLSRACVNGIVTCSPPCPSWSRGGKNQGLQCENGISFSACISKIRCLRPIAVLFECADTIVSHKHYKILRLSLQAAGFQQMWSQVVPYDQISNMMRTRWLSVWVRNDVEGVQKCGWNSSYYDFPLPNQLQHQLILTKKLLDLYGNSVFLPQSKKCLVGASPSINEVLFARCLKNHECMPTLCASYSQQHMIDIEHLKGKGIFATLRFVNETFQFFSPLMCAALLGAVDTEPVFIPTKLAIAFLHIGNAISVHHAVLALSIALVGINFKDFQVSKNVADVWKDRLTVSNTVIFRSKDFVIMCPLRCIRDFLPMHNMCGQKVNCNREIIIDGKSLYCVVNEHTTLIDLFFQFGFEMSALKNIMCTSAVGVIPWNSFVQHVFGHLSFLKSEITFLSLECKSLDDGDECDSLDHAIVAEIEQIEKRIESERRAPVLPCIDTTSIEIPKAKRLCQRECINDSVAIRANLFVKQGIPLATGELNWIVNVLAPKFLINIVPIVQNDWMTLTSPIRDVVASTHDKKIVKCMCLIDDHWFAIEIRKSSAIEFFCINAPKSKRSILSKLFESLDGFNHFKGSFAFSESSFNHGFCGWELVINWFGIVFPPFEIHQVEIQQFIALHGSIAGGKPEDRVLVRMWQRVCSARFHFLKSISPDHSFDGIRIGLTQEDQEMPEAEKKINSDPWVHPDKDPWNQAKKACKWEDLKLPEDHHFKDVKGQRVVQIHRQQISSNTSGVAFATKSCVVDTFGLSPPKQTALLLPNSDKIAFPELPKLSITGPFEIVVRDNGLNSIYKRQVLLIQTESEITFQLQPQQSNTRSLLLKLRLISKELASNIIAKPLETIKAKLLEQIPPLASKSLGVFGFRIVKVQPNKDSHRVFQVVCKVQADQRNACLERSGAGDAFIRDYIPKGDTIEDLTIIPRFWETERAAKDDALRMSASLPGFAGLVHTRRGLAVRAWCKQVASVRQVLQANDERISKLNQSVIPRCLRDSTGWPAVVGPQEIVRATVHSVSLAPIPTRCFKAQGVTKWTLAFDSAPKIDKFMIQINTKTYEIILTEPNEKITNNNKVKRNQQSKGSGKEKSTEIAQIPVQIGNPDSRRITSLEAKFSAMERRQDSLESKINDGFSSVNDQLRQVLHAIQPRSSPSHTGMTPPQKAPKTT